MGVKLGFKHSNLKQSNFIKIMKRKYEKFTAFSLICIAILGVTSIPLQIWEEEYRAYVSEIDTGFKEHINEMEQMKLLIDSKMVRRCVNDSFNFTMSDEGLFGECGTHSQYNEEKNCYEIYTYGEDINGSVLSKEVIQLIESAPKTEIIQINEKYPFYGFLKIANYFLIVLAFLFSVLALTGFKKLR